MSNRKRKRPDAGASGSEEDESSAKKSKAVIKDMEGLKCPICLQLPRGDVFLCSNGHSVCNECMEKLVSCPTCRVPYQRGPGKIRNHFAEEILSKVLFECTWKAEGCDRKELSRQEVAKHEAECMFNPTPVKLCQIFFRRNCDFEIIPAFLRNPSLGFPVDLLEHIQAEHFSRPGTTAALFPGASLEMNHSQSIWSNFVSRFNRGKSSLFNGGILRLLDTDHPRNTIGLFILYGYVDKSEGDFKVSWFGVRITDKPPSSSVSVKFTLKGNSSDTKDGNVPNVETSWYAKIMSLAEFYRFKKTPGDKKEKFKFSLPWSRIQEYYLNEDGGLRLRYTFSVTEDADVGGASASSFSYLDSDC